MIGFGIRLAARGDVRTRQLHSAQQARKRCRGSLLETSGVTGAGGMHIMANDSRRAVLRLMIPRRAAAALQVAQYAQIGERHRQTLALRSLG